MKKKGFTLIELLAVIIILAIIALIATPIILNVIEDARKSAGKSEASMILSGINNYCATSAMKNQLDGSTDICNDADGVTITDVSQMVSLGNAEILEVEYENGKVTKLKVKSNNYEIELQPDGSFSVNGDVLGPVIIQDIKLSTSLVELKVNSSTEIIVDIEPIEATTKDLKWTSMDSSVAVVNNGTITGVKIGKTVVTVETTDGSNIKKEINVEVKEPILSSANSCITNSSICPNGTSVSVRVNDSETYDFYVIKDDGKELTLIMNQNLGTSYIQWLSKTDYVATGGLEEDYDKYGRNEKGPLTALNALEDRTKNWTNIPAMTYVVEDDGGKNNYQPLTRTNVRARLLTYTEALELGCTTDPKSCPNWLYEGLVSGRSPMGYWTSASGGRGAWNIIYSGYIYSYYTSGYASNNNGVRPVITVVK